MRVLYILIFLSSTLGALAQNGSITGTVTTSDGQPAEHVNIILRGTTKGATTDSEGKFDLKKVPQGSYILIATFVGFDPKEQNVEVLGGQAATVTFVLSETSQQLSEVVVEGSKDNKFSTPQSDYVAKVPLKNMENPQVYTSLTNELLTQQLVFSVDDAIKNAPGLQKMWEATGRGGDGGSYYNARGFILQSQLRDGIAGNVSGRIDAANIERIEVIKGPSATLFGSTLTSYGGLINRITKKPYAKLGGEISYASGSYGFNRVSADINTPLDHAKNILLRLNTAYNYEGSFQDNGFDKGYVIAPSLSFKVTDRLSISVDAELYRGENTSKQMIFFYYPAAMLGANRADELGIDYMRSYSSNDIFQVSKSSNFFVQANYKMSDTWKSQTNYTSNQSFSDGPYAYFYMVPNSEVTGDPNATGSDYLRRADQSTANSEMTVNEFQQNFIGDFKIGSMRNRMVIGLDLFTQNSNQFFYGTDFDIIPKDGNTPKYRNFNRDKLDSALMNGTPWTYPYEYKTNTYSAYVSDAINLTDNLIALLAVRFDHFDNKGSYDEATGEYFGDYTQNALSPKFGLVYQPIKEKVSLFGNYQNGFTNQTGQDYEGKTFKPEQANQAEVGVKLDLLGGKISTTISYYNIKVKDLVRSYVPAVPDPTIPPNAQTQDGTQLSKGFEIEVIANPLKGFNIIGGFAYNHSEFEKADEDVVGRRPATAMSPYSANFWVSYQIPQGVVRGLGFGLGGNYASDNKILNSDYYGEFILPAYTVLNATAFYDHAKFRVGVKVDNLTDEHYWIGYTTMNAQKLRSFTGSLTIKF